MVATEGRPAIPDAPHPPRRPGPRPGLTGSAAEQRSRRLAKVDALRARGVDPYPVSDPRDRTLAQVRDEFGALEAGAQTTVVVHVAGRVMLRRDHGGLVFLSVKDESGLLQVMASRSELGEEGFADIVVAARSRGLRRSVLLAAATGILYGVAAALTKSTVSLLDDGLVGVLTSWEPYALAAAATLGTYLQQAAFQAGDLAQSLPAVAVLEPVVAVALGIALLDEELRANGLEWALIVASAVAMVIATAALARSQGGARPAQAGPVEVAAA